MGESVKRILIVDDELPLLNALRTSLTAEGFDVLTAENGDTGYKKTLDFKPDLIILDILMPKLNGLDMLKKLRGHDSMYCKNVAVLVLTNLTSESALKNATELECLEFIIKTDVSLADIVRIVKSKLKTA